MVIDKPTQSALGTLSRETSAMVADDRHKPSLSMEQRELVIAFADRGIQQNVSNMKALNELAPMRVQARYVAGSLAMVDPQGTPAPFRDASLNDIYRAQHRYMEWMQTRQRQDLPEQKAIANQSRGLDR